MRRGASDKGLLKLTEERREAFVHRLPLSSDADGPFARVGAEKPSELEGTVLLWFEDPEPVEVPSTVVRREEAGFWVRHHCTTLRVGQVVAFCEVWGEGTAQVISTEQKEGYVESRFWILSED
jgi:hypothetical protein